MPEDSYNLLALIKKYFTTEFLTVITLLIYGWGFLYNYSYYNNFNINIISYLSLQDILLGTIPYIFSALMTFAIIQTLVLLLIYFILSVIFLINKKNLFNHLNIIIAISAFVEGVILTLFLILTHLNYIILKIDNYIYQKYILPSLLLGIAVKLLYSINVSKNKNAFKFGIAYIIYILFLINILRANTSYLHITKSKSNFISTFELSNGKSYSTNDSILYIGETNSTIFLFAKPKNNTIIINKANVIQTLLLNQATIKVNK